MPVYCVCNSRKRNNKLYSRVNAHAGPSRDVDVRTIPEGTYKHNFFNFIF